MLLRTVLDFVLDEHLLDPLAPREFTIRADPLLTRDAVVERNLLHPRLRRRQLASLKISVAAFPGEPGKFRYASDQVPLVAVRRLEDVELLGKLFQIPVSPLESSAHPPVDLLPRVRLLPFRELRMCHLLEHGDA